MPTCSVIIPCYNAAAFLRATLESVLSQTHPASEVIVVDDGSTDDSAEIAACAGPPVRLIRQTNQGESRARNVGLRAATAEHVLFLDADDLLAPESLERLLGAVAGRPRGVALMGFVLFNDDGGSPVERRGPEMESFFPGIVQTNVGPPHCCLVPRTLALEVGGFREDLVHSEDWEFWGRIALSGAELVAVPYEGALYRRHARSQVARASKPEVFRGRLVVAETLAAGILRDKELLERTGEACFWSLWAMLRQARNGGVPTGQLENAEILLRTLATKGPSHLRRCTAARTIRLVGVRATDALTRLTGS